MCVSLNIYIYIHVCLYISPGPPSYAMILGPTGYAAPCWVARDSRLAKARLGADTSYLGSLVDLLICWSRKAIRKRS